MSSPFPLQVSSAEHDASPAVSASSPRGLQWWWWGVSQGCPFPPPHLPLRPSSSPSPDPAFRPRPEGYQSSWTLTRGFSFAPHTHLGLKRVKTGTDSRKPTFLHSR